MSSTTTVLVRRIGGYQQEIAARQHVILADEPAEAGGYDSGLNPYELLLSSLGACKSITVSMYAQRKGWDLQSVEVELTHSRVYRQDCEACENKNVRIDCITVKLTLGGSLDTEQKHRLHEIAGRCPIHQTLMGDMEIVDLQ